MQYKITIKKNLSIDIWDSLYESQRCNVEWKEHILYDFIYVHMQTILIFGDKSNNSGNLWNIAMFRI